MTSLHTPAPHGAGNYDHDRGTAARSPSPGALISRVWTARVFSFFLTVALVFCLSGESAAAAPSLQSRFQALITERNTLAKDARRSMLREGWEKIAGGFTQLAKDAPFGDVAMNARFEAGRTWQELANRSRASKDYTRAVDSFTELERIYRGKETAAQALLLKAAIQARDLKDNKAALATLDTLLQRYPKSGVKTEAQSMRAALVGGATPAHPASTPAPAASSVPPLPKGKADPATASALYTDAAGEWRILLGDAKRGSQRDNWVRLEKRFLDALGKDPQGATAPKARFQAGRCLEELAARSYLKADWLGAVAHFEALAAHYPKSSLADDGLYRAALIQAKRLDNTASARKNIDTLLRLYPKGDMAASARELLRTLPAQSAANVPGPAARSGAAGAQPSAGPYLRAVRWQQEGKGIGVVLELEAGAKFSYQHLGAGNGLPARLQIDITGVSPGPGVKKDQNVSGGTAVSRIRVSSLGKVSTRVLLDLSNATHYGAVTLDNPPRILVRVSRANDIKGGFAADSKRQADPVRYGEFSSSAAPQAPQSLVEQLGLTVKTIMIDAGHGGKDPGAMGNGITEKTVTLKMAKLLGGLLAKQGFTVLYTRDKDVFISLEDRPVMANNKKADLFISLHVNANQDTKICGVESYFMDMAQTSGAAQVAARENAVSVKSISDLQFILADLMLSSKLEESREMAGFVHKQAMGRLHRAGFESRDNGVRSAPFYVLMGARMPAVLVEIGYLTNPGDARRLKNDKYLQRLAEGIAEGVVAYKSKISRFAK